jgi:RimJ/RimL family protein N-acetyltransferase
MGRERIDTGGALAGLCEDLTVWSRTVLRSASEADVGAIRRWRNQAPNRQASIQCHEITEAEHARWWAMASSDPTRRVLIFEYADQPAGVVNFFDLSTAAARTASWGFFLDAEGLEARGESLPAWISLMREATGHAFDELALNELRGEVLAHNTVVRRMNRRFGFVEGPPAAKIVDGRRVEIIPIALTRDAALIRNDARQRGR